MNDEKLQQVAQILYDYRKEGRHLESYAKQIQAIYHKPISAHGSFYDYLYNLRCDLSLVDSQATFSKEWILIKITDIWNAYKRENP